MGVIGIAANPNSGKDIRRLVTHATVIDNGEKINIIRRIVMAARSMGDHKILIMPDRYELGYRAIDGLKGDAAQSAEVLDMDYNDNQNDTTDFVREMRCSAGADVMIVMGGDGTSRAAAKEIGDIPMIPLSTGTNNVFPQLVEGTAAGLAAAAIAGNVISREESGSRVKRIEITVEGIKGVRQDLALIDAVMSRRTYAGARALWDTADIGSVLVTQCHPYNIGFSALAGCVQIVSTQEDHGLYLDLDWDGREHIAALSAGIMTRFGVRESKILPAGTPLEMTMAHAGIIAVDGEREIPFREGDKVTMTITWGGPRKVDVKRVIEASAAKGFFRL